MNTNMPENNNWYYKIKRFFLRLLKKDKTTQESTPRVDDRTENSYIETLRTHTKERENLLQLQKDYLNGKIKEEELTNKQKDELCDLFDRQIEELRRSNEARELKILQYNK